MEIGEATKIGSLFFVAKWSDLYKTKSYSLIQGIFAAVTFDFAIDVILEQLIKQLK
jgi:hypothetical protein